MAEYDPQRSRPRRRVTDEPGPAPVDAMLDAKPEVERAADEPDVVAANRNGDRPPVATTEVVDLAPAPPVAVERSSRRARLLLVAIVVGLALIGFVLRRVGAARRARRLTDS